MPEASPKPAAKDCDKPVCAVKGDMMRVMRSVVKKEGGGGDYFEIGMRSHADWTEYNPIPVSMLYDADGSSYGGWGSWGGYSEDCAPGC